MTTKKLDPLEEIKDALGQCNGAMAKYSKAPSWPNWVVARKRLRRELSRALAALNELDLITKPKDDDGPRRA